MTRLTVEQATKRLGELVTAANKGEEVVVVQADDAAVRLVPVPAQLGKPIFGSAKGLLTISNDFDEPILDFEEYRE
ncbi:MAG: type II toxin-antitoxin system prevent-host-death family antitoxin [Anaerolineae bacterium]|nr:type II toxin-antitoxin system prevent-host-death family antitoxin [Phycisphaerae bacterium]